jgi:serine/threonine-protein kinase
MQLDDRVYELVARYERLCEDGQEGSLEELCRDCPELLPDLADVLVRLRRFEPPPKRTEAPPAIPGYADLVEVGRGGMGVVYRAHDPELHRTLAVKVLLPEHRGDPGLERRFLEEAQLTAQLQHPGIPPVHRIGRLADGRPFFAMKLVQGRTLADLLGRRSSPAERLPYFLGIFAQVCQAMAYAHSRGVVHRDLKPGNVMVGAFGEGQVMDWGLAKALEHPSDGGRPATADTLPGGVVRTVRPGDPGQQTEPGALIGTLSYMSPEQAQGAVRLLDRRADVFGLGALLCEVLTGHPPYTTDVYQRAMLADLSEAEARLDGCGADPDLVRLAKWCLAARREDRPGDAGAVAEAVAGYQAGVEARLRRAELERAQAEARSAQERRVRRRTAALVAVVLMAALAGGGGGLNWAWQRARLVQGGDEELARVRDHLPRWELREAETALLRAEGWVAHGGPADLRERVRQMREHWELMRRLEQIRLARVTWVEGRFDDATANRDYTTLFQECGLVQEDTLAVAARIQGSPIRAQLVAALDDWATATESASWRAWILEVARRADPGEWNDRFRNPEVWSRPEELERLAREARVELLTPQLLSALGVVLWRQKRDPVPLLRAAQERHPTDFWIAFTLGNALLKSKPGEAEGYYRVALAVRPDTSSAHYNLGNALIAQGKVKDAIRHYRQALDLDPRQADAHINLGKVLDTQGKVEEAFRHYRQAFDLDPRNAKALINLGAALSKQGKVDEAIRHYRKAIDLDPRQADAHFNLGTALHAQRKVAEAVAAYKEAIRLRPDFASAHGNLGAALGAQGKLPEAVAAYKEAIRLRPDFPEAHSNLGLALQAQGKLPEAVAAYKEAIRLRPTYTEAHYNLGVALQAQGKLEEALAAFRRAAELPPPASPLPRDLPGLIRQVERQLALAARLGGVLKGDDKLADAAEGLAFARLCADRRLHAAAARLYAAAFAADARLADDRKAGHRYDAACSAALAGCSTSKDDPPPDEAARARLRRQARDWLRADLAAWRKRAEDPNALPAVRKALQHWQKDTDLAGVREPSALTRLPEAERHAWQQLWQDVQALLDQVAPLPAAEKR